MSGQRTIIYKKPIAKKAARVYNLIEALPIGSYISRDEIYELCKLDMKTVIPLTGSNTGLWEYGTKLQDKIKCSDLSYLKSFSK